MNFRFDEDQLALRDAVGGFCADRFALASIGEREGTPWSSSRWHELADLGVFALLVPDADGGLGLGLGVVEAALVFEQLGRHLVDGPLVWSTLGATSVPGAIGGSSVVGGFDAGPVAVAAPDEPVVVEHATDLDVLLVLRPEGIFAVEGPALGEPEPLEPLDPLTPVARFAELPVGTAVGGPDRAARLRAEGTVLTAALQLGVSDAALQVARDHALEREQFGRPIASFQALKHMMADMFVRTGLARSATFAAAAVLDEPEVGHTARSVSAAKLLAGEAAIGNARAAVQILGGMGFTWDMLPNYLLKRSWVLEHAFGTQRSHALGISASLASEVA